MKRKELEKYLKQYGCKFLSEGKRHTKWHNPEKNLYSVIPRHSEIDPFLARAICKQLGVKFIDKK